MFNESHFMKGPLPVTGGPMFNESHCMKCPLLVTGGPMLNESHCIKGPLLVTCYWRCCAEYLHRFLCMYPFLLLFTGSTSLSRIPLYGIVRKRS